MRFHSPGNRTKFNDYLKWGADFRVSYRRQQRVGSSFNLNKTAVYLLAEPADGIKLLYANNQGGTSEAYLMYSWETFPVYVRAGRFFIPYGLNFRDVDITRLMKGPLFSPSVGLDLTPTQSDTGVEAGLNPEGGYFLNMSMTNAVAAGGASPKDNKALTGRGGVILKKEGWGSIAVGGSYYHSKLPTTSGQLQVRYGPFGWIRYGPVVLLGEYGRGFNKANATQLKTRLEGASAELDIEVAEGIHVKGQFDSVNPDFNNSLKDVQRYLLGLEWFPMGYLSVEGQYRILKENPEVNNNEALLAVTVWF